MPPLLLPQPQPEQSARECPEEPRSAGEARAPPDGICTGCPTPPCGAPDQAAARSEDLMRAVLSELRDLRSSTTQLRSSTTQLAAATAAAVAEPADTAVDEPWDVASVMSEERSLAGAARGRFADVLLRALGKKDEASSGLAVERSLAFRCLGGLMTALNSVVLAVDVDLRVSDAFLEAFGGVPPDRSALLGGFQGFQRVFLGWYGFEIALRLVAYRASFFMGKSRYWNLFDVVLFIVSAAAAGAGSLGLVQLRALGVARALPAFQSARFFRHCGGLYRLAHSAAAIAAGLFWMAIAALVAMYIVGVLMLEGVHGFLQGEWQGRSGHASLEDVAWLQALHGYYGDLARTLSTLFGGISGADWSIFAGTLGKIGRGWSVVWVLYIVGLVFGISNILTGIVVNIITRPMPEDNLLTQDDESRDAQRLAHAIEHELARQGLDADTTMSKKRLLKIVKSEGVQACLRSVGVPSSTAEDALVAVDPNMVGGMSASKMARQCLAGRGQVKVTHLACLAQQISHLRRALADMEASRSFDPRRMGPEGIRDDSSR